METINELAAKLLYLQDVKTELAEETKKNNAEIKTVELQLYDLMVEQETNRYDDFTGHSFTLQTKNRFSSTVDKRNDLIEALKMYGIDREEIVTETISSQRLNNIMGSIYEENGEELPEEFDDIVSLYIENGIKIRKIQGKGGKSKAGKEF